MACKDWNTQLDTHRETDTDTIRDTLIIIDVDTRTSWFGRKDGGKVLAYSRLHSQNYNSCVCVWKASLPKKIIYCTLSLGVSRPSGKWEDLFGAGRPYAEWAHLSVVNEHSQEWEDLSRVSRLSREWEHLSIVNGLSREWEDHSEVNRDF